MKRNIRDKNKNKGDSWIHRKMLKSIRREHTRPLCNKALWHYHMNTPFHTLYSRDDSSNGSSLSRSSLGEHGTPFPSMHYGTPFPSLPCTILCETSSLGEHGTPFPSMHYPLRTDSSSRARLYEKLFCEYGVLFSID